MKRFVTASIFVLCATVGTAAQPSAKERSKVAQMVLIPGATYEMGQRAEDVPSLMQKFGVRRPELFQEEAPRHRVTISPFYLDRTEVTNAQFKQFVDKNPSWRKGMIDPKVHNGKYLEHWNGIQYPEGLADHPVVFVPWQAAVAFCRSQGKRLPTEAEWEFAARGGLEGKIFPWGDELPDKTRANYKESGIGSATKVGSYPANGYGLFDMAGNVWEYLSDEWQKYPLPAAPTDTHLDRTILDVKTRRAIRGGSYGGGIVNLRVTYRDSHSPENAGDHVGFRCAMSDGRR